MQDEGTLTQEYHKKFENHWFNMPDLQNKSLFMFSNLYNVTCQPTSKQQPSSGSSNNPVATNPEITQSSCYY